MLLWARHEKSTEVDGRGERNITSRCVTKTTVHAPVLTEEQNGDISDVCKGGYILVTLPRIVTPYRDSVDETRARVTYQKLVTR